MLIAVMVSLILIDAIKDYNKTTMMYNQQMEELMRHPHHVYDSSVDEYTKDLSDEEIVKILGL
jgi:hypothetical protein